MLKRVAEITYFVPDLKEYLDWLVRTLDARPTAIFDNLIQCRVGSTMVSIHPSDDKGEAGPGGQVAYWAVSDLNTAITRFEQNGARLFRGPLRGVDGPWVAQTQDPWGNVWGLIQTVD